MIIGIGTDLIEVERVAKAYEKAAFRERTYTERERELIGTRNQRAAGNFAVKEAVVKALGTGFRSILPNEVEVLREESGKPYVIVYGNAQMECEAQHVETIHVSISDTKEYATAYVVLEGTK